MKVAELFIVLDTKLDAFNKGMSDAERAMVRVGKKFTAVGKKMTMMVTLPLLAIAAAAVKMGADFEQSMMNAASVSGATGEELKRMEGIARDMGETTVFSARQAADAMYFMASAGWKVNDMGKAIKPTLDLAAATQSDLAFATDTVVASLNQFQLGSAGAGRLANVFAAAIGNSQATMEKLSISMRYVGPLFHSMGKEVEEAAATLMVLYNAGYDASMAGTALRMGMVKLMDGTKKTTDALKRLNLSLKEVDPTTMHFADIIEILGKRGAKTKDVIDIFGVRAGPAFAALISQGGAAIRKFEKGITGTNAAAKMAEMQINTLKGSFKLLTSALTEAAIQIFKLLGPGIKDLVDNKLKPAVLWFNSLSESTKKTILVVGGLAAAAGPLLLILGKILIISSKIKVAMVALTGPFGIISGLLIGLAIGAKRAHDGFKDMGDAIKDMEQISGKRMSGFEKLWWKVSNAVSKVTTGIDDAKIVQAHYNQELAKAIEKYKDVPNILNLGGKAVDGVSSALEKGWEWLKDYGKETEKVTEDTKAFEKAQKTLIKAIEFTLDPEMKLAQAYADGSITLLEYTSKMRELREERAKMADDLADLELAEGEVTLVLEEQGNVLLEVCENLGLLPPAYEEVEDAGIKAAKGIGDLWKDLNEFIEAEWIKTISSIIQQVVSLEFNISDLFKQMTDNIVKMWSDSIGQIATAGMKAGKSIGDIFKDIKTFATEGEGAVGTFVMALKATNSAAQKLGLITTDLGKSIGDTFGVGAGIIADFVGKLFGIESAAEKAQKAAEALATHISDITKVMSKYGEITEATAKKIQEADKTMTGFAAVSKNFGDVIRDVGVTQENVNLLWERAVGIIENWHQGHLTAAEAAKAAGESFTLLLEGTKKLGQEGSAAMVNFILKTRELGLEVQEVTEYVVSQLDRIPDALESLLAPAVKAGESLDALKEALAAQNKELSELEEGRLAYFDLQDAISETGLGIESLNNLLAQQQFALAGLEEGTEEYEDMQIAIKETRKAIVDANETLKLQIDELAKLEEGSQAYIDLQAEIEKTKDGINEATIAYEEHATEVERAGILALATFNAMIDSGVSWTEAVAKMKDPLIALRDQYDALGLDANAALEKLFGVIDVTEAHKELFETIDANKTILDALGNSGFMTGEILNSFAQDAIGNYEKLKVKFEDSDDALRAMGPTLQKIKDFADAYNITLDEGTQKLIDQATELGIVKEKQESVQEVAKKGFGDMKEILTDIKDVLIEIGNKLKGSGIHQALKDIDTVSKTTWGNMTADIGSTIDKVGGLDTKFGTTFSNAEIAARLAGQNINAAIGAIQPRVDIGFDYDVPSFDFGGSVWLDFDYDEPEFGGKGGKSFQHEGIAWRPQLARVAERGPEAIVDIRKFAAGTSKFSGAFQRAESRMGEQPIVINYNPQISAIDSQDVYRFMTGKGRDAFEKMIKANIRGITRHIRKETDKYSDRY